MKTTIAFLIAAMIAVTAATPIQSAADDTPLSLIEYNGFVAETDFMEPLPAPIAIAHRQRRAAQNKNSVNVGVDHGRHGTNVAIEAQRRLWQSQNGRSTLDGQASYNQHFGPRSPPNYGVGVQFRHRF